MSDDSHSAQLPPDDQLAAMWRRVREHKVVQWTIAYVALAYGIQHGVTLTSEAFEWPNAVMRVSMLLLALGFPLATTLAWYHGARASRNFSQAELSILSTLLAIGSLLFFVFVQPSHEARVASPAAAQAANIAAARAAAASPKGAISLAVLPFLNLSSDKEQEFFSDGMTEEITAALAKVPDLRVVARTSAFQFKGKNVEIEKIGEQLHATHLIEGSVRKAGNRLRITAQLIKADDGTHIWAEDYDRELTDVFAIQEDIARAITTSLRMPLGLKPGENLVNNRQIDPESYQQYLRAKALVSTRVFKALTDAAVLLEQVVARYPGYAPAWADLAHAYELTPLFSPALRSDSPDELRSLANANIPKTETAARRAIQLDPNLADGYIWLTSVLRIRGRLAEADELDSKTLSLDPSNPDTLFNYATLLAEAGRLKDALPLLEQVHMLEPYLPAYTGNRGGMQWVAGQTGAAIATLNEVPPGLPGRRRVMSMIYAAQGRYAEAADELQKLSTARYSPGMQEAAVRLLKTAPKPVASPQTLPRLGEMFFVYLFVGAVDRVLDWYEDTLSAGYPASAIDVAFLWHPSFAPVRKTERFKAFVRKLGLVEYWRAKGWPEFCHPTTGDDFVCN